MPNGCFSCAGGKEIHIQAHAIPLGCAIFGILTGHLLQKVTELNFPNIRPESQILKDLLIFMSMFVDILNWHTTIFQGCFASKVASDRSDQ